MSRLEINQGSGAGYGEDLRFWGWHRGRAGDVLSRDRGRSAPEPTDQGARALGHLRLDGVLSGRPCRLLPAAASALAPIPSPSRAYSFHTALRASSAVIRPATIVSFRTMSCSASKLTHRSLVRWTPRH